MEFVDTQLLIAAQAQRDIRPLQRRHLCSVAACEFLDMQTDNPVKARYHLFFGPHRFADSFTVDFNNCFPSIREYNHRAIAQVINGRNPRSFSFSIGRLANGHQRRLRRRLKLILEAEMTCQAVWRADVETALGLLDAFTETHTLKADFRNSWNDLLILAVAANASGRLLTVDSLLARFSADILGGRTSQIADGLAIKFPSDRSPRRRHNRDSKGYINRGWRLSMLQHR